MIVYRLSRKKFIHDLSGKGAELFGGRWNSKGFAMLYTTESKSLATLEILVHVHNDEIPVDYCCITLDIPDDIETLNTNKLISHWKDISNETYTQKIGTDFVNANNHLVLKVPSAIIDTEFNYLINPHHTLAKKIKIIQVQEFSFDKRLIK
jgi:RES domain-containing protein